MARIPRSRLGQGIFHVINRAHNLLPVLADDDDKQALLSLFARHRRDLPLNIHHWVIMDNHFHLAVEALKVEHLTQFIGKSCEMFTRHWRKRHGGAGTLWQGRFRSMTVQKQGYLARLGRYIERNPVAAHLCQAPWDYAWSSARAYVNGSDDILVNPSTLVAYREMGRNERARQSAYRRHLMSEQERWAEDAALFGGTTLAVGDDVFLAHTAKICGRLSPRRPGRPKSTPAKAQ